MSRQPRRATDCASLWYFSHSLAPSSETVVSMPPLHRPPQSVPAMMHPPPPPPPPPQFVPSGMRPPPPPPSFEASTSIQYGTPSIFTAPPLPPQSSKSAGQQSSFLPPKLDTSRPSFYQTKNGAVKRTASDLINGPSKFRKLDDFNLADECEKCDQCLQRERSCNMCLVDIKKFNKEREYKTLLYKKKLEEFQNLKALLRCLLALEENTAVQPSSMTDLLLNSVLNDTVSAERSPHLEPRSLESVRMSDMSKMRDFHYDFHRFRNAPTPNSNKTAVPSSVMSAYPSTSHTVEHAYVAPYQPVAASCANHYYAPPYASFAGPSFPPFNEQPTGSTHLPSWQLNGHSFAPKFIPPPYNTSLQ